MKKLIPLIALLAICATANAAAESRSETETAKGQPKIVVDDKARDEAKGIIADAGIQGGLVVHLGCGDPSTTSTSSGQAL